MKKFLSLLLALMMALGMLSVAGAEIPDDQWTIDFSTWATAADNGMVLPEIPGGVLKIKANIALFNQSSAGTQIQKLWEQAMEHYLGVDVEVEFAETPWADFRANELTKLAAGSVADINSYSQGGAIQEYGEEGVVLNLAEYEDYIHYYKDYIAGHPQGEAYHYNADGSAYVFWNGTQNTENIMGAQSFTAYAYRFDVLQKLGLTPATTLDEFTALCATLKEKIDAGEVDASYVMMNSTKDYAFYRGFVGAYHTWDTLYWNGSEWSFGPIEDNFREMLTYLAELYAAGYIDPELATSDYNASQEKAAKGYAVICPNLWAGSAAGWNTAVPADSSVEWGLAYLPSNTKYGTAWKWGSKLGGKFFDNALLGTFIGGETEYPEYCVAMIDYQYSDEMVTLMNWGIEGVSYTVADDGAKTYVDDIMVAPEGSSPALESANYGLMASSVCRSGIPFIPINFSAMVQVSSNPEPWWNPTEGYYMGKYWIESDRLGGEDSVSPYDRPAALSLDADQSAAKSQLTSACELYAKEEALKFITGQYDVNDDAAWEKYVQGVKSQSDEDFDETIAMLNANSIVD